MVPGVLSDLLWSRGQQGPQTRWFKRAGTSLSQARGPEPESQVSQGCSSHKLQGRVLLPQPASGAAGIPGLWPCHCVTRLCLCPHVASSFCVSSEDTCHWIWGPPGKAGHSHLQTLKLMIAVKTLSQMRSHPRALSGPVLGGHQPIHSPILKRRQLRLWGLEPLPEVAAVGGPT